MRERELFEFRIDRSATWQESVETLHVVSWRLPLSVMLWSQLCQLTLSLSPGLPPRSKHTTCRVLLPQACQTTHRQTCESEYSPQKEVWSSGVHTEKTEIVLGGDVENRGSAFWKPVTGKGDKNMLVKGQISQLLKKLLMGCYQDTHFIQLVKRKSRESSTKLDGWGFLTVCRKICVYI